MKTCCAAALVSAVRGTPAREAMGEVSPRDVRFYFRTSLPPQPRVGVASPLALPGKRRSATRRFSRGDAGSGILGVNFDGVG